MDVTPLVSADAQVIQSYTQGYFKVSSVKYDGAILVSPEGTQDWVAAQGKRVEDLVEKDFMEWLEKCPNIDMILLGTGKSIKFLEQELRQTLKQKGLNIECMDTGAACRTYNVLMAEGRRVVAALIPV